MKKNQKGFTIIELGVSICLVSVVAFLLYQIVLNIKQVYVSSDLKTNLLTKQAVMIKKIYDDLDDLTVSSITNCNEWSNSCLQFTFIDGTTKKLLVNPINHVISYDNYAIDYESIDETIYFGSLVFSKESDFFSIQIPITSSSISGNYGLNITKMIGSNVSVNLASSFSSITLPLIDKDGNAGETYIVYDGNDYWLKAYEKDNGFLNMMLKTQLRHLKLDTCSNAGLSGTIYELRTEKNTSRWCQKNNFYTQTVSDYQHVSGILNTSLGKDTYQNALITSSSLADTVLLVKVNQFIDRYTFKAR